MAKNYNPFRAVADEGSFGKTFIQELRAEQLAVEGFRFSQMSKQQLITNLRDFFDKGKLIINASEKDLKTSTQIKMLIKELQAFGVIVKKGVVKLEGIGEHDDMVISLALACWTVRGAGNVSWKVSRGASRGSGNIFYVGKI